MAEYEIAEDDPLRSDVLALLEAHLAHARTHSPPEDVHALDPDGLTAEDVTFFSLREGDRLLAVGALRHLDDHHGEIKSMHTAEAARGRGLGRSMVEHLLVVAQQRSYQRLSLETGTMDGFAAARALYASFGFEECEPFGNYWRNPNSVCMTLRLA